MVFFNYFNLSGIKSWAAGRVRALSKSFAQLCGLHQSRIIGIAYLAISVVLGLVAFSSTHEAAIAFWERTFLPSDQIIHFAFGSRGLIRLPEGNQTQKVFRSLPLSLDERGSIWLNIDPPWVVAFPPTHNNQSGQPVAFCLPDPECHNCQIPCKIVPKNWQPMGLGWRAMDKTLGLIDQVLKQRKELKIGPSRRFRNDPREIIY